MIDGGDEEDVILSVRRLSLLEGERARPPKVEALEGGFSPETA